MNACTIVYNRRLCTGAGACEEVIPERFRVGQDKKAVLIDGKKRGDLYVVSTNDSDKAELAAEACPVNAITVEYDNKKRSGNTTNHP